MIELMMADQYLAECREHLATVETGLLAIENGGAEIDDALVDRVYRAVHAVKEGAGVLDLVTLGELARQTGNALALIRSHDMVPTRDRIGVLLRATDKLHDLIEKPGTIDDADIAALGAALSGLQPDRQAPSGEQAREITGRGTGAELRVLLVEDDFACRLLLQTFLSRYGECHVAVNGREAVDAFCSAAERERRYDLICMDIMMPEMDGREAVRRIRAMEEADGIPSTSGAKIVMTTAVDDIKEVGRCFNELCDAYLVKPIDLGKLLGQMKSWQLAP